MPRGHMMDLTGQRFSRLVVEKFHSLRKGRAMWECLCDCGNRTVVQAGRLRGNRTRSCGCYRKEKSAERSFRHGMLRTPTYLTWVSMIQRCENPKATGYEYYGGREFEYVTGGICLRLLLKTWANVQTVEQSNGATTKDIMNREIVDGQHYWNRRRIGVQKGA